MAVHTEQKKNWSRFAGRNKEQFMDDIKESHKIENDIMMRYAQYYQSKTGKEVVVSDNGVDNSGEYVEGGSVTMDADYLFHTPNNKYLIEVKHHREFYKFFRLKAKKMVEYVKQDAHLLLVNGYSSDDVSKFTIMSTKMMKRLLKKYKNTDRVYKFGMWENKLVMEMYADELKWFDLPPRILN